ncbi:hypothetical protein GBA52_002269 [Prunus armeniaca]|nr:hypothetical protein GBA52_002269 [Prunus armeniaca]
MEIDAVVRGGGDRVIARGVNVTKEINTREKGEKMGLWALRLHSRRAGIDYILRDKGWRGGTG